MSRRARLGRGWEHRVAMLKCVSCSRHVFMLCWLIEMFGSELPLAGPCVSTSPMCVTTETRQLAQLGQLGEFEQESNTHSEPNVCDLT